MSRSATVPSSGNRGQLSTQRVRPISSAAACRPFTIIILEVQSARGGGHTGTSITRTGHDTHLHAVPDTNTVQDPPFTLETHKQLLYHHRLQQRAEIWQRR